MFTLSEFSTAQADTIRLAAGYTKPPYIFSEQKSGIELDIVREAFAAVGHEVQFEFFPSRRLVTEMDRFGLDGCLTQPKQPSQTSQTGQMSTNRYLSDSYITYQNKVFALEKSNIELNQISDMSQYSLIGFQRAFEVLGPEFSQMVEQNHHYSELAEQRSQVNMLFTGRAALVVMDEHIFRYYQHLNPRSTDVSVSEFPFFPPSPYHLLLARSDHRDQFNLGLIKLKESGRYQQLLDQVKSGVDQRISP